MSAPNHLEQAREPLVIDADRAAVLELAQYECALVLEALRTFIADRDNDAFAIRMFARGQLGRLKLISSITHDVLNDEPFNPDELDELQGGMQ